MPFSVNVFVPHEHRNEHLYYWSAILNGRLLWKWFQHHAKRRGVALEINGNVLRRAPIKAVDFTHGRDQEIHDLIVQLVRETIRSEAELRAASTAGEAELWQRRRDALVDQIDDLTYELYELGDDEIALVRAATTWLS